MSQVTRTPDVTKTSVTEERMDAATWLADRGFGKPAPVRENDAPGIGDFTITIGDHDARGNPLDERYKW